MNTYLQGQSIRLGCTFRDSAGATADPDTVTLDVQAPDSTVQRLTLDAGVTRVTVGEYQAFISLTIPGQWAAYWHGTAGDATPAAVSYFSVRRGTAV